MAKISIVLADPDELYLNKLTNYFSEKASTFDVCSFISKETLIKYLSDKQNKPDLIVLSEKFSDTAIAETKAVKIFFSELKNKKPEKLLNSILKIYADKSGRVVVIATGN